MTQNAIVAESLVYRYGSLTAVDGISFSVAEGEILGFLGPNGAGKTTTARMLTGQSRPHGGRALLLGLDVARETSAVQAQIGVCFEITNLYEQMTGIENLTLFGKLYGVRDLDAQALLRRVGLDGRGRDRVGGYSKGMKQRLMVARALVHRPRILFLDEPTTYLDIGQKYEMLELVRQVNRLGKTVVMVLHDLSLAFSYSHQVVVLEKGAIAAQGDARQVFESGVPARVFGVASQALTVNGRLEYLFTQK